MKPIIPSDGFNGPRISTTRHRCQTAYYKYSQCSAWSNAYRNYYYYNNTVERFRVRVLFMPHARSAPVDPVAYREKLCFFLVAKLFFTFWSRNFYKRTWNCTIFSVAPIVSLTRNIATLHCYVFLTPPLLNFGINLRAFVGATYLCTDLCMNLKICDRKTIIY